MPRATKKTLDIPAAKAVRGPNKSAGRKIAMIVELLCRKRLRFSAYEVEYGRTFRMFQRDLQQLRQVGKRAGYELSKIEKDRSVRLVALSGRAKDLEGRAKHIDRLTATIARALGEPIAKQLESPPVHELANDDFFSVTTPRLVEGTAVAELCATLRDAASSTTGRAYVRFRYPAGPGKPALEREVEPYRLTLRSGNFYLVGYDRRRHDWRVFALDRFRSKAVRSGTCLKRRTVPIEYASDDVIGFIKGSGKRVEVTVELSARVADGATARTWQGEQRVERRPDGRALMTLTVSDVAEIVRWTLGFGAEARVIAPPEAVERARRIVDAIERVYVVGSSLGESPADSQLGLF